jgi:8-oxo-dGTP diphosphatase
MKIYEANKTMKPMEPSGQLKQKQKPSITVDGIVIDDKKNKKILLIKRAGEPFKGWWALPGGFVEYGETTEHAAMREVKEETGLRTKIQSLLGVYSDPNRDPRGHTISIVYQLEIINGEVKGGSDAKMAKFFFLDSLPQLAFDHEKIIKDFMRRMEEYRK